MPTPYKNVAQPIYVLVYDKNTGNPAPDSLASSITGFISKDKGAFVQTNDVNPTAIGNDCGIFAFDMLAAELNCDSFVMRFAISGGTDYVARPISGYTATNTPDVNVVKLNGAQTDGPNATLQLKRMVVSNNDSNPAFQIENSGGNALSSVSTGGSGHGISVAGYNLGPGIAVTGGAVAPAIRALASGHSAVHFESSGGSGRGALALVADSAGALPLTLANTLGSGAGIGSGDGSVTNMFATGFQTNLASYLWGAARSSYSSAGTFGQGVASVQGNITGSVASVVGAVGSVTGNVGGNVAGSVGSVTGNVGGNVAGSVGSVTAMVTANVTQISGSSAAGTAVMNAFTGVAGVTVTLKQLAVTNNAGDAIVAVSTGGNGAGIKATGQGSGAGMDLTSGATSGTPGMKTTGQAGAGAKFTGGGSGSAASGIVVTGVDQSPAIMFAGGGAAAASIDFSGAPAAFSDAIKVELGDNTNRASLRTNVSDVSPTSSIFKGPNLLSSSDSFYIGCMIAFETGALKGLARKVTSYTGSTRQFTVSPAFPSAPANGDELRIIGRQE